MGLPLAPQRGTLGASNAGRAPLADVEEVQGSSSSLIDSLASILDELVATGDAAVTAAQRTSLCPQGACGSFFGPIGSTTPAIILICIIAVVAGTLAFRARRRRPSIDPSAGDD